MRYIVVFSSSLAMTSILETLCLFNIYCCCFQMRTSATATPVRIAANAWT